MSCLIVEDDGITGPALKRLLEDNGWSVEWATCLEDAYARLEAFDPSLLLLDVQLDKCGHGESGLELLRHNGKSRRVVVLTAAADREIDDIKREFPSVEVLRKPAEPVEIIRVIGRGRKTPTHSVW